MNKLDNCKRFRSEPDWTPNNYDITFDPSTIPSNIQTETANNLQRRLEKLMPSSKRIHINIFTEDFTENNDIKLVGGLKISGKEVKFK